MPIIDLINYNYAIINTSSYKVEMHICDVACQNKIKNFAYDDNFAWV